MSIEPLSNYVLVKKDEEKETTNGGIILTDAVKEKPSTGTVVAVGPGKYCEQTGNLIPMQVKVGDRVFFLRLGGQKIEDEDGTELTVLKPEELLGIIR